MSIAADWGDAAGQLAYYQKNGGKISRLGAIK